MNNAHKGVPRDEMTDPSTINDLAFPLMKPELIAELAKEWLDLKSGRGACPEIAARRFILAAEMRREPDLDWLCTLLDWAVKLSRETA